MIYTLHTGRILVLNAAEADELRRLLAVPQPQPPVFRHDDPPQLTRPDWQPEPTTMPKIGWPIAPGPTCQRDAGPNS